MSKFTIFVLFSSLMLQLFAGRGIRLLSHPYLPSHSLRWMEWLFQLKFACWIFQECYNQSTARKIEPKNGRYTCPGRPNLSYTLFIPVLHPELYNLLLECNIVNPNVKYKCRDAGHAIFRGVSSLTDTNLQMCLPELSDPASLTGVANLTTCYTFSRSYIAMRQYIFDYCSCSDVCPTGTLTITEVRPWDCTASIALPSWSLADDNAKLSSCSKTLNLISAVSKFGVVNFDLRVDDNAFWSIRYVRLIVFRDLWYHCSGTSCFGTLKCISGPCQESQVSSMRQIVAFRCWLTGLKGFSHVDCNELRIESSKSPLCLPCRWSHRW